MYRKTFTCEFDPNIHVTRCYSSPIGAITAQAWNDVLAEKKQRKEDMRLRLHDWHRRDKRYVWHDRAYPFYRSVSDNFFSEAFVAK